MKIKLGEKVRDFSFETPLGYSCQFSEIYRKNKHTLILFLRYYGCTICQLDLMEYKEKYQEFKNNDAELVVVLQSEAKVINETGKDIPYIIACDPEKKLYDLFEIVPAKSIFRLLSVKTIGRVIKASKLGLKHGAYEGEGLQLPAAFMVDQTGRVVYSKYAKTLSDLPKAEDFVSMTEKH